ncbi:MAG: dockerin type I repeat-containing protein, partial [Prevotella sp.]|nr:dockerin type I repeat-containing protein [Prevotella sp.]
FQYGGEVKFGTWWVDCQDFVIESIKVYTDGTAQTTTTTTTTQTTTTTTKAPITSNLLLGDANGDGKVSVADAVLIMQSLSNPTAYQLTAEQAVAADVVNKGDGVTTMDALAIQMLDIGLLNLSDLPISSDDLQNRF